MPLAKPRHNPGFLTDSELVESFCGRGHEFDAVVERLRAVARREGSSGIEDPKHQILIGPRGSGKTFLLLRVAAELRRDPELAAGFFPICLAEESYEVAAAGEFWLECLARLGDQAPEPERRRLRRSLEKARSVVDDRTLSKDCRRALRRFSKRVEKRLVLVVENLDMLLEDLQDADAGRRLAKSLRAEDRIVLLASASGPFRAIADPEGPLRGVFHESVLRPFDTEECGALWESVSGKRPAPPTIRALEILTGGNPRLIAIVARFGAEQSFPRLMAELLALVDDHTDYFRSRIESLAPQERRVCLALAGLWKPATTRQIAAEARLDTNRCSAQLARLVARGDVQVVGGTARRKQYYLTERLYNIYYLLRRRRGAADAVTALVRFMEAFYAASEAHDVVMRELESDDDGADWKDALASAIREERPPGGGEGANGRAADGAAADREARAKAILLACAAAPVPEIEAALASLDRLLTESAPPERLRWSERVAGALLHRGWALRDAGFPEEALKVWSEVAGRFGGEAPLRKTVARAVFDRAYVLHELRRWEEAVAACDDFLRRADDGQPPLVVAAALLYKAMGLAALRRPDRALAACEEMVDRFGAAEPEPVRREVAAALALKGDILSRRGALEEALEAFEEAAARVRLGTGRPSWRRQFALIGKADVEYRLGRYGQARETAARLCGEPDRTESGIGAEASAVRAAAALAGGETAAGIRWTEELLELLAGRSLSRRTLRYLMEISNRVGPERMFDLIEASASRALLLPLATALGKRAGRMPPVPLEVVEAARDVEREMGVLGLPAAENT